jgi:uncharacterized damage-inducible protein DinB
MQLACSNDAAGKCRGPSARKGRGLKDDSMCFLHTQTFPPDALLLSAAVYTFSVSIARPLLLTDVRRSAWADQRLLNACASLTAEELKRDFRISHTSILLTLGHFYDGQRVWLDCLQTTPDQGTWRLPQGPSPELSLEVLRERWPEIWNGFQRWIEAVPETALAGELTLQLPGGVEPRLPRWKILRHVLEHSTMHRGQVIGMIRMLGHQPPAINAMDYYLVDESDVSA